MQYIIVMVVDNTNEVYFHKIDPDIIYQFYNCTCRF